MNRTTLTAWEAVRILHEPDVDPARARHAPFRSGADVCEILAAHFGFTGDDYERLLQLDHDPYDYSLGMHRAKEDEMAEPAAVTPDEHAAEKEALLGFFDAFGRAMLETMRAANGGANDAAAAWHEAGLAAIKLADVG